MMLEILAIIGLALAALPASMVLVNVPLYRRLPRRPARSVSPISVLIPARNEEATIGASVRSILAQRDVELEVVVMDDGSTDRTAEIVRDLAASDSRVRLESSPPLPTGWCGKQHACAALARVARHDDLVFMDADVRLLAGGLARISQQLEFGNASLISGIPRQETGSWSERLVIPLVHFVLLGFLPLVGMRVSRSPAFAAGCGQLIAVRREAYEAAGGHGAIRGSRHDGIALPRAFRQDGQWTDLFDATDVASCRMYKNARELWDGFAKNATEGMAGGKAIWVWTTLLVGGHVLPWMLLGAAWWAESPALPWLLAAIGVAWVTRLLLALRFRQSLVGALLHPFGITMIVAIQWYARLRARTGSPIAWKGRANVEL